MTNDTGHCKDTFIHVRKHALRDKLGSRPWQTGSVLIYCFLDMELVILKKSRIIVCDTVNKVYL